GGGGGGGAGGFSPGEKGTCEKPCWGGPLNQPPSKTDAPPRHYELPKPVHSRNCVACRKFNEPLDPIVKENIIPDEQSPGSCLDQACESGVDFAVGACLQYLHV